YLPATSFNAGVVPRGTLAACRNVSVPANRLPAVGPTRHWRYCDKRQAKHRGEDAAENQICHDFFLPAEVAPKAANFGWAGQKKNPSRRYALSDCAFRPHFAFLGTTAGGGFEGCPRLRLDRDRQRSTKGW